MMDWIEMNGRLLSPEEEREIDLRTKKQAAAVAPIRPKMVSTADIDRQLLGTPKPPPGFSLLGYAPSKPALLYRPPFRIWR